MQVIDKGNYMESSSPYVVTFCSGKGGVGKSVLAVNLGVLLSQKAKVLIWDTNIQFPNIHLMMGVEPPTRLNQVYSLQVNVEHAIFSISNNLSILAGSPAELEGYKFADNKVYLTFEQLLNISDFDYIIIDTAAGYSEDILQCCSISDLILLTMTDEPTSMLDAYGLLKIMKKRIDIKKMKLVINNVIDSEDAKEVIEKFNLVTEKFLEINVSDLGFIPYERAVRQSILMQEVLIKANPDGEASKAIELLANRVLNLHINNCMYNAEIL